MRNTPKVYPNLHLATAAASFFLFAAAVALVQVADSLAGLALWPKLESLPPMPLNMAFFVFLFALGLLFLQQGRPIIGFAVGLLLSVFGLFLFSDYVFHQSSGAADLLLANPLDPASANVQAAPGSALAILLMGIATFSLTKARGNRLFLLVPALATIGVIAVCIFAVAGAALDLPLLASPGSRAESIVLLSLGIGAMLLVIQELRAINVTDHAFLPIKVGGILLLATIAFWQISSQTDAKNIHQRLEDLSLQKALAILDRLAIDAKLMRKLAAQLPLPGAPGKEAWITNAQSTVLDIGATTRLEILDAQKAFAWDVPLRGPKPKSGGEMAGWQAAREKMLASVVSSKRAQFSTIEEPRVDESVFMIAAPAATGDRINQYIVATIQSDLFLNPILSSDGISFDLMQNGKPAFSTPGTGEEMAAESWYASVRVPSNKVNWSLRMRPSTGAIRAMESETPAVLLALGIILSLIVAVALHYKVSSAEAETDANFQEKKFAAAAELLPVCLLHTDGSGELLSANTAWTNLTGLSLADSLGHGWKNAVHPEDRAAVESTLARDDANAYAVPLSFRAIGKDGGEFRVSGSVATVKGGAHNAVEFIGAFARA